MSQSTAASTPAGPSAPPSSSTPSSHPQLAPGTFRPILPLLDEILSVLQGQATSEKPVGGIEAGESVAKKARELHSAMEGMRSAAMNLPGGHLSVEEIRRLESLLEAEGDKRRAVLRAFAEADMPATEALGVGGSETVMNTAAPTPMVDGLQGGTAE
ncbi:hypothetical protein EHS25_008208 [Saitozyma podzolica]|uniref:Mediator complex subunit 9 n=1 Tax=Saitozyma podzolica TaxID=1890683 RepID=A0A427YNQ5_9TREE|nr:hypothetical protein EHS25_008208 [Saitozyma podzolica]